MFPDIYMCENKVTLDGELAKTYGIVFEEDNETDTIYKNGPFSFLIETKEEFDWDKLEFAFLGVRCDPIDVIAAYDGVGLYRCEDFFQYLASLHKVPVAGRRRARDYRPIRRTINSMTQGKEDA